MSTSNENRHQYLGTWDSTNRAVFSREEVASLIQQEVIGPMDADDLLNLSYNETGQIIQKPLHVNIAKEEIDRLKDLAFLFNQRGKKRDDLGIGIENPRFNYYRASGDAICPICGEIFYEHPVIRGKERRIVGVELFVLCNTDRVKL